MRSAWKRGDAGLTHRSPSGILVVLLTVSLHATTPGGLDAQDLPEPLLQPGTPLALPLAAPPRVCRVFLQPGEFVEIHADQPIELELTMRDPSGVEVVRSDLRAPLQGPERVYAVAAVGGDHRITVEPVRGLKTGMHSTITVTAIRAATDRDRALAEAAVLYSRALAQEEAKTGDGLRQALDLYRKSLGLWRRVGATFEEGRTLHKVGFVHARLGEPDEALRVYEQALEIRRGMGDRYGEGITLSNMAVVHINRGDLATARDYYERARVVRLEAGDPEGEAGTLQGLGYVLGDMGSWHQLITYTQRAAELWRQLERPQFQGLAEHNIGWAYAMLGDYDQALAHFERGLALRRGAGDVAGEAQTLNQLGSVYRTLGEYDRAIEFHQRSLAGRRRAGDRRGEAYTLQTLGHAYFERQEFERARETFASAVELFRAVADRDGLSSSLAYVAAAAGASGQGALVQKAASEALQLISQSGYVSVQPMLLNRIGDAYLAIGDYDTAGEHYERARLLSSELRVSPSEATALMGLGRVAQARGALDDARDRMASAIEKLEALRVAVTRADLRASYLAARHNLFESYVAVLMALHARNPAAGFAAQALASSERRRARSLLETLFEARANVRAGVDPELLAREQQIQGTINAKAERLARLAAAPKPTDEVQSLKRELDAHVEALREVWAQIRARSPRYAALTRPAPVEVETIQRRILDDETLLLEYALGTERSYMWAVTSTSLTVHELPGRATIEKAARQAYELASRSTRRELQGAVRQALADLSAMILRPVAGQLGDKRLVVVPDGALQYVPFAALPRPGGEEPLIVRHELVTLPSASVMEVLRSGTRERLPEGAVAVLADPVLNADDSRVTRSGARDTAGERHDAGRAESSAERDVMQAATESGIDRLDRLPFTRQEANAIVSRAGASFSMRALDFDASRETATSADLARFRVGHFATHALLNTSHPELSGIVLSLVDERGRPRDGFLRLHDIFNLRLNAQPSYSARVRRRSVPRCEAKD